MARVLPRPTTNLKFQPRWLVIALVALAAIFIILRLANALTPERTPKTSADWSRGARVGQAVDSNPVALWAGDGDHIVAVWSRWIDDRQVLHWARLNRAGAVEGQHDLALNLISPRQAQLVQPPSGDLQLFFTALASLKEERALFRVALDEGGTPRGDPVQISESKLEVPSFAVVTQGDRILAFWTDSGAEGPNLHGRALSASGEELGPTALIAQGGENPSARVDQDGAVHLVWSDKSPAPRAPRSLYYTTFVGPDAVLSERQNTRIADAQGTSSDALTGPVLGLTTDAVYVLWTIEHRGGQSAGELGAYFMSAPLAKNSAAQFSPPTRFDVPTTSKLGYAPYPGTLPLHELAPLAPGRVYFNEYIQSLATPRESFPELPVALSMNVMRGFNATRKIGLIVFAAGRPTAYAVIGETDAGAMYPSLAADAERELYVTWLDQGATGTRNVNVYFAATTSQAQAELDRFTPQDALLSVINALWGMSGGLALLPLAFAWMFPGLLFATLFTIVRTDADMSFWPERIGMAVAVLIYYAVKLALVPGTFTYVPFSTWVPVLPAPLPDLLRVLTPILIGVFALGVAYYSIVKLDQRQLLWMYVFFVIADVIPTALLYGPSFLGR